MGSCGKHKRNAKKLEKYKKRLETYKKKEQEDTSNKRTDYYMDRIEKYERKIHSIEGSDGTEVTPSPTGSGGVEWWFWPLIGVVVVIGVVVILWVGAWLRAGERAAARHVQWWGDELARAKSAPAPAPAHIAHVRGGIAQGGGMFVSPD